MERLTLGYAEKVERFEKVYVDGKEENLPKENGWYVLRVRNVLREWYWLNSIYNDEWIAIEWWLRPVKQGEMVYVSKYKVDSPMTIFNTLFLEGDVIYIEADTGESKWRSVFKADRAHVGEIDHDVFCKLSKCLSIIKPTNE